MAEIAVRDEEPKKGEYAKPKKLCTAPAKIVGVQDKTPLCWDSSGKKFAFASNNRSIYIWERVDTPDGNFKMHLRQVLRGAHIHPVVALVFDPNFEDTNTLVSAGGDGIIVWNVATGEVDKTLPLRQEMGQDYHTSDVECVKYCFDGNYLISGSRDNSIKIWDAKNGYSYMETLNGHKAPVLTIDFDPSKQLIGSAGRDSTVKVWDASSLNPKLRAKRVDDRGETVQLKCSMDGHRGDVCALSFFNNGDNVLSGARDNTMKIWSIDLAREEREVKGNVHNADVRRIIFLNPEDSKEDKQFFASCGLDGLIKIWLLGSIDDVAGMQSVADKALGAKQTLADIMSDQAVADLEKADIVPDTVVGEERAHDIDVWTMEVANGTTRNGDRIFASCTLYNEICFWSMSLDADGKASFKQAQKYIGHRERLTSMQLIGDENLITSSCDYSCHLYNLNTMECLAEYDYGGAALRSAVTKDSKYLLVGGTEYDIKMYDLRKPYNKDNNGVCRPVALYKGHSGRVISLSTKTVGNMNILASGGHDFDILLWKIQDGLGNAQNQGGNEDFDDVDIPYYEPLRVVEAHEGHVMDLQFSESLPYLVSGGNDHAVKCWELSGTKLILKWHNRDAHDSVVTSVCWGKASQDADSSKHIFSASWDTNIYAWDFGKDKPIAKLRAHTNRVTEVETSPNGQYLYSCGADFRTYVWQATGSFNCLCQYRTMGEGVISTLSTGKNYTCTGDNDGLIRIWPSYGNEKFKNNFEQYHERRMSLMALAQSVDEVEEEKTVAKEPVQQQGGEQTLIINVQVPEGASPGQTLQITTPKGIVQVKIPPDTKPGATFQIQV